MNDWYAAISVSLLVHGAVFCSGVGIHNQPSVNVKCAPSSIEISLVTPHVEVKERSCTMREVMREVVKSDPRLAEKETVENKKEAKPQAEKKEKAVINTQQGALLDAEPLSFENEAPKYPRVARVRGYEGEVLLVVEVREDGRVGSIRIKKSSGYSVLDTAAMKAVRRWQFKPAMRGEHAFSSTIDLPVVFRLRS